MKRSGFVLVLVGASMVFGGTLASVLSATAASAGDPAKEAREAEAVKAKREKLRKERIDAGDWPYFDLSHNVTAKSSKLSDRWSWSNPPHPQATEDKGVQFIAQWENKLGSGADIRVVVQKWEQKNNAAHTKGTFNFDSIGKTVEMTELEKLCDGFSEEWKKKATDVIEDKCVKTKKAKGMGPAAWYACAVGTDAESKKRERHEWFVWQTVNTTWLAEFTYQAITLDKPDWLDYGVDLMKATKALKAPD